MNSLIAPILNLTADPAGKFSLPEDDWYHLIPVGEFPHPESGFVQVIDADAVDSIIRRFDEDSQAPHFAGLLVDQEHWSYDPSRPSEAFGWIQQLERRPDGVWGRIKWTELGEQAVASGRYRLRSPTWLARDVERLDKRRIRPLRLDSVGLTNNPNLKGMPPLSNRDASSGASSDTAATPQHHSLPRMRQLLAALGLSGDASEESALAELARLKQRASQSDQTIEPLQNRIKALEKENTDLKASSRQLLEKAVDQDLEKYGNRFRPEARDTWKAQLIANREGALQLLESLADPSATAHSIYSRPLHNRNAVKHPGDAAAAPGTPDKESARAKAISSRAREIARRDKKPYSQAWQEAEAELHGKNA